MEESKNKLNYEQKSKLKKPGDNSSNPKEYFGYSLSKNSSISTNNLPHKIEDRQEELFMRFLETWSDLMFDTSKVSEGAFLAKNSSNDTFYININPMIDCDETKLLNSFLDTIKKTVNVFHPLPRGYKTYINGKAKETSKAEDQLKVRWVSLLYDTKSESYLGKDSYFRKSNKRKRNGVPLSYIVVKYLSETSALHMKTFEAARNEGNKWKKIPPGVSSNEQRLSNGYRKIQHDGSPFFRFYFQGNLNTCVFSSLASALSYKGYHEASKIVSENIEISASKNDSIKFVIDLLNKVLTIKPFKEKDKFDRKKSFRFDKSSNHPILLQLSYQKGHDVITADHAICICNNLIFDSNYNTPMKLNLTNLNKCCKNVTKPSCNFGAVIKGWIFEEKTVRTRETRGRTVRVNSICRSGASTKRKQKKDLSHKVIIDNLDRSTKDLSLQLLSKSFKKCAESYPKDNYLKASRDLLDHQNFNVFDVRESFLTRKGYGFKINKKFVGHRDILYGVFEIPTLMLISIETIFCDKIYDIIVISRGEIFTSCFESGVQRNEQNIEKYMDSKDCDDFRRVRVLKTLCFYGKTVEGHNSKFLCRGSRGHAFGPGDLSRILKIDLLFRKIFEYIGNGEAEEFNASEDISMMIRRKRGLIRLKEDYDLTRCRVSRKFVIAANKAASVGDEHLEKIEWDNHKRLLHELFLTYENDRKEVQDLIVSCWEQKKDKICLALYLEEIPATLAGILLLNKRYMNNFTRDI